MYAESDKTRFLSEILRFYHLIVINKMAVKLGKFANFGPHLDDFRQ